MLTINILNCDNWLTQKNKNYLPISHHSEIKAPIRLKDKYSKIAFNALEESKVK